MVTVTITDIAQGSEHSEILDGLRDGTLRRHGGVIRHAAGRPQGGQIYAHLKDMGNDPFKGLDQLVGSPAGNPPIEMGQLLNLQSLTAVTSMVNLGVSVAGFAYTAHQMHKIRDGISTLQRLAQRGFEHVDARLDDVTRRLEELVILQRADLLLTSEIRAAVEDVRSLLQTSMEAHLTASIESLRDLSPDLCNVATGHGAARGRERLSEYVIRYGAAPVPSDAPCAVLIRLGRWKELPEEIEPGVHRSGNGYRPEMPLEEVVDATRAWWRVSPRSVARRGVEHAVAVHEGVTRAVMRIGDWTRRNDGRWAFAAEVLEEGPVYDAWIGQVGRRVEFVTAAQNPIIYWPVKET